MALGDCAGGTGGQENTPGDSYGLIGLVASIIQDIFGSGSGGNPAPDYQRAQNKMGFGRFNDTAGISSNTLVLTQSGDPNGDTLYGIASYYEPTGNLTRSGLPYNDRNELIAAMHPEEVGFHGKFPYGTEADVTYVPPGSKIERTVTVRVIDKGGPALKNRLIDLSPGAFKFLTQQDLTPGIKPKVGLIFVKVEIPARPTPPLQ